MNPAALPLNFVQIASECRSPKVYEKDELTLLIRQTKDSELKFARGGARHRAGLRSAGSAEAVLIRLFLMVNGKFSPGNLFYYIRPGVKRVKWRGRGEGSFSQRVLFCTRTDRFESNGMI